MLLPTPHSQTAPPTHPIVVLVVDLPLSVLGITKPYHRPRISHRFLVSLKFSRNISYVFEISFGLTIVLSPFSTLMSIYVCLKTETTAMYHFAHITYGWQSILGRWYFCLCRIQLHKRLRHPKIFKLVIFLNEFSKRTPRVSVEMSSGNPMRCNACQKMSIFPLKFKFFPIFSKCRMLSAKAIE